MCVYMYHLHIHALHTPPNTTLLYNTPGQNKRSMLNQLFLLIFSTFHRKCWFHTKSATFHENQQNQVNMCVYMYHLYLHTCTTTYQQKMIYLVGLPSVLYERPGQNERPVLNQMFLLFFRCFSVLFMYFSWKAPLSYKKCHFSWKQTRPGQYVCIHIPPNITKI